MSMTALPDIQLALRPGIAEVRWSNPDPALLPTVELAERTFPVTQGKHNDLPAHLR